MSLTLHETLLELRKEITAGRYANVDADRPATVEMHPISYEDLLLDHDWHVFPSSATWSTGRSPRLFGIDVREDWDLPEGVLVVRWPDGRLVVLRKLETTPIRAMVRDGIRRAHPWLRLPVPVPPPAGERWAVWVFPAVPPPRRSHYLDAFVYGFQVARPDSFVKTTWPV